MATTSSKTTTSTKSSSDLGASQVSDKFAKAAERGYFGEVPDETPNANYTLAGVTSGKKTPESVSYHR